VRPLLPPVLVAALVLLAGCSGSSAPSALPVDTGPPPAPAASTLPGALTDTQMTALLLTAADLPGLSLRPSVDPVVELSSSPQLALCHGAGPRLPHQAATLLAKGTAPGQALVFQSVAVYADPAAARTAWKHDIDNARTCRRFPAGDLEYTVSPPAKVDVGAPGAQAYQYRLTASNVISGDVRTLVLRGRSTVLLSSYGKPADGSELTTWQAGIARKAAARLAE
jgi:hypothetical protein